jgi:hypothetical protein
MRSRHVKAGLRGVVRASLPLLWLALASEASAQSHPQDAIDRNLQERAAREREFHVRLEEERPQPILMEAPRDTGLQFTLRTPGTEILQRDQPEQARPTQARAAPGKSVVGADVQLRESQRRRQVELQTQTQNLPETARQPDLQIQQLEFDRETRAQELGSSILRESQRALGTGR